VASGSLRAGKRALATPGQTASLRMFRRPSSAVATSIPLTEFPRQLAQSAFFGQGPQGRYLRSPDWLKMTNPDVPAVKREAEEDWAGTVATTQRNSSSNFWVSESSKPERRAWPAQPCGFFGGSLCTSSGHRSSINSRIGSEMASMRPNSRTSLCIRSISSDVMILPSKTRGS